MTTLIQSVEARYGVGVYDPKKTPPVENLPQAKPLYTRPSNVDPVVEHGEWCASKCVYPENEARVLRIIEEHLNG
jgi:hypothetical protein